MFSYSSWIVRSRKTGDRNGGSLLALFISSPKSIAFCQIISFSNLNFIAEILVFCLLLLFLLFFCFDSNLARLVLTPDFFLPEHCHIPLNRWFPVLQINHIQIVPHGNQFAVYGSVPAAVGPFILYQ